MKSSISRLAAWHSTSRIPAALRRRGQAPTPLWYSINYINRIGTAQCATWPSDSLNAANVGKRMILDHTSTPQYRLSIVAVHHTLDKVPTPYLGGKKAPSPFLGYCSTFESDSRGTGSGSCAQKLRKTSGFIEWTGNNWHWTAIWIFSPAEVAWASGFAPIRGRIPR